MRGIRSRRATRCCCRSSCCATFRPWFCRVCGIFLFDVVLCNGSEPYEGEQAQSKFCTSHSKQRHHSGPKPIKFIIAVTAGFASDATTSITASVGDCKADVRISSFVLHEQGRWRQEAQPCFGAIEHSTRLLPRSPWN